jgi:hypothetical protein
MRFRARDGEVLSRSWVIGRRLAERVAAGMSDADLYEVARGEPLEAVLAALVSAHGSAAEERLAHFLQTTRFVRLDVSGDDLLTLGFEESPQLGEVLRTLLHLKLNGVIASREEALETARRLR